MKYFDVHAHIQFAEYDADLVDVLARMQESEVGVLIVGTDSTSSKNAIMLCESPELTTEIQLRAAIGLHPNDKPSEGYDDAYYTELAQNPLVVAIGECGLDYFRPENPEAEKARQKDVFARHIELAGTTGKPLMIHARPSKGTMDAYDDAFEMLKGAKEKYPNLMGNMHFFVGDIATVQKYLTLNFTFSYTAVITFTTDYDEVIRSIPLSNLLTETDSPYVAPAPNRGKRNEPTAVIQVVAAIARIKDLTEEEVRTIVLANAHRIFNLNP